MCFSDHSIGLRYWWSVQFLMGANGVEAVLKNMGHFCVINNLAAIDVQKKNVSLVITFFLLDNSA